MRGSAVVTVMRKESCRRLRRMLGVSSLTWMSLSCMNFRRWVIHVGVRVSSMSRRVPSKSGVPSPTSTLLISIDVVASFVKRVGYPDCFAMRETLSAPWVS